MNYGFHPAAEAEHLDPIAFTNRDNAALAPDTAITS
jgi:hypothetical protein